MAPPALSTSSASPGSTEDSLSGEDAACLARRFERWADRTPEVLALVANGGLTYAELEQRANQLAHRLRESGARPGGVVALLLPRADFAIGALAALKAGAAYLPLDMASPGERLRATIADAAPAAVVVSPDTRERLAGVDPLVLGEEAACPSHRLGVYPSLEAPAYVIYTSGSTGEPKGVLCTHRGVTRLLGDLDSRRPLAPGGRCSLWCSTSFDVSVYELFSALTAGNAIIVAPDEIRASPDSFVAWLARERITSAYVPAFMLEQLAAAAERGLLGLERLLVGVEPIAEEVLVRIAATGVTVVNGYGPTETAICATLYTVPASSPRVGRVPIGRAVAGDRVLLLDEDLQKVAPGTKGEIYIGGAGLAHGYLKRPGLTAARFVPDPFAAGERLYRTGDVALELADGNLEFIGRNDHQVKVRGFRVELGEIDAALQRHERVSDAVTVLREVSGDRRLVSYVVPHGGAGEGLAETLRAALRDVLPVYMVPSAIVSLDTLPVTANGKVDRDALPEPVYTRSASFVAATTPLEADLCSLWAELLGVEEVGVDDNFFALGGHSLLAAAVAARIRTDRAVAVPNDLVFRAPTVAQAAAVVQSAAAEEDKAIPLAPRDAPLPLSLGQRRMWFSERWRPGTPAYNCPYLFRLDGPFDQEACVQALNEIIRRHELLRTTFAVVGDEPVQEIAAPFAVPFEHVDLRGEADGRKRAEELVDAAARRPFDLSTGPVIRVLHLELGESEHQLLVSLHHTVVDGMSYAVWGRELSTLYSDYAAGRPPSLPPLQVQYADYAAWQRRRLRPEALASALEDWAERLKGVPELLALPTDYPRAAVQQGVGALYKFTVPAEVVAPLRELAATEGATLFMALTAALKALLARYSGQEDIVLGTPSGGRTRPELDDLIGFFVNMLVLRSDLSGDPSFIDVLSRVRQSAERAYANEEVPFELILEQARPERTLSHTPLFQVTIVQEPPLPELDLPGVRASCETADPGASKFDLSWMVYEVAGDLRLEVEYDTGLFRPETVARMGEHFTELLAAVGADPTLRLSELPLTSGAAEQRAWNNTAHAPGLPEASVPELVARQAAMTPEATALLHDGVPVSYSELDRWAESIAVDLTEVVEPDAIVAVYARRSPLLVAAALGAMKAGAAYLALDPTLPQERLRFMIADAGCCAVVGEPDLLESLSESLPESLPEGIPLIDGTLNAGKQQRLTQPPVPNSEGLAYVVYTSGSTGTPKGVGLTHRGLHNLVDWHVSTYGVGPDDRGSHLAGLGFDASVWELWPYLSVGASVLLWSASLDPDHLLSRLDAAGVSIAFLPTPLAEAALDVPLKASSLRLVLTGGDQLRRKPPPDFPVSLVNHYGPTEASVVATAGVVDAGERTPPSIGRPISNTTAYVLDESLRLLPPGLAGLLYIGGEGVARGYLNQPALTARQFLPDPFSGRPGARLYCTGDRVRHLADGRIEFLGRVDNQVKIRGHRIEVGEVEAALLRHPLVAAAAVAAVAAGDGGLRLAAYVVLLGSLETEELRAELSRSLPSYMVPTAFVVLDELPLNSSGKVDRRALPDVPTAASARSEAPLSDMESMIAEIWTQLLKLEQVTAEDSFFDVGGDSLLAVQLISRIKDQTGADLDLRQVFEEPILGGLARLAEQAGESR